MGPWSGRAAASRRSAAYSPSPTGGRRRRGRPRHRGTGEIERGAVIIAEPGQRTAGQSQAVAVGIGPAGERGERRHRPPGVAHPPLGGGQQPTRLAVVGLARHQPGEPRRRPLDIAGLEIDRALEQHSGRRRVERTAGAVVEQAGELEIAGARGEHRLEIISGRMAAGQAVDLADVGEHVGHPTDVAISDGALEQGGDVGGVDLQRPVEPGQSRGEAILLAGQLAAQHQRLDVGRPRRHRPVGGVDRAGHVAIGAAEAGEVGPDPAVPGSERDGTVEGGLGAARIAERDQSAAGDARGISVMGGRRQGGLLERALRIALEQAGMGEQVTGLAGADAELARAHDLRFRRDAVAEREMDPRLHDPGGAILRIGLQRVEELDPRGADVALVERRHPPRIRRAAAGAAAGGRGEQREDQQPAAQGPNP